MSAHLTGIQVTRLRLCTERSLFFPLATADSESHCRDASVSNPTEPPPVVLDGQGEHGHGPDTTLVTRAHSARPSTTRREVAGVSVPRLVVGPSRCRSDHTRRTLVGSYRVAFFEMSYSKKRSSHPLKFFCRVYNFIL